MKTRFAMNVTIKTIKNGQLVTYYGLDSAVYLPLSNRMLIKLSDVSGTTSLEIEVIIDDVDITNAEFISKLLKTI